jgi:PAS domain S-box-containing protein
LIVEDSEDDTTLLLRELKRGGYEPTYKRVETPLDLIQALEEGEWDVIFADNSMPYFSAPAALKLIREGGLDLPFIIVSGTITDEQAVTAMKAGANDYLIKGNLARLVPAVQRELREAVVRMANRKADELLRESEEKYHSLVENIPDVSWRADRSGAVVFVSSNVEKILGFTPQEMYRKEGRFRFGRIHPDDIEKVKKGYEALFEEGAPFDVEYRIQRKDDLWIWVGDRSVRTFERNGVFYADGVFSDVTRRKKYEEELRQFAFIASHDLREPLRKVQTFGERLRADTESVLSDRARDYLVRMEKASARMEQLLEALLQYSRVTMTGRPFEPVDLNKTLREVLSDLDLFIAESQGTVEIGSLPTVSADPIQMRQLFENLLLNALKFRKKESPPRVSVKETSHGGEFAEIRVADNGIGFDEKYLDRIFQPFQRLSGELDYEGTGMGLAICQKLVERHGGKIIARSEPGKGSTFVIVLPRSK